MESMTAKVSCFARAHHFKSNDEWVFKDEAAEGILGEEDYSAIAGSMTAGIGFFAPGFKGTDEEALQYIVDKQLAPPVLARSAFCEAHLRNEARLGLRQYAIFASGCDTFALRCPYDGLKVFELDMPDTLADKQRRIEAFGLKPKTDATMVACDLSAPQWVDALVKSGFNPDEKSFGSLLGISYYLTKQAFYELLGGIASLWRRGSAICFDYPAPQGGEEAQKTRALAAGANERMRSAYEYGELEQALSERGFLIYEHLDARQMTEAYFRSYNAHAPNRAMAAPAGVNYVLAVRE